MMTSKRKTSLIRVYTDDLKQVKMKFPEVTMPNFFHISVRSNPFLQVEAVLRSKRKK